MMFTIVGGGFGLYGYLPALFNIFGGGIILPEVYRKIVTSRVELRQFDEQIQWEHSVESALLKSAGVVIATPPLAQIELLREILILDNIKEIVIEKPVAPTVDAAIQLFDNEALKLKRIRVGYTFIYSDWYPLLRKVVENSPNAIKIIWNFEADHIAKNKETWKRYHSLGGGVLRFYGIHIIAVLASLGYETVIRSNLEEIISNQPIGWEAVFHGNALPKCNISISINSNKNEFMIIDIHKNGSEKPSYLAATPFDSPKNNQSQDVRVPILESLIRTFDFEDYRYSLLYREINSLWNKVELSSALNQQPDCKFI